MIHYRTSGRTALTDPLLPLKTSNTGRSRSIAGQLALALNAFSAVRLLLFCDWAANVGNQPYRKCVRPAVVVVP